MNIKYHTAYTVHQSSILLQCIDDGCVYKILAKTNQLLTGYYQENSPEVEIPPVAKLAKIEPVKTMHAYSDRQKYTR